MKRILLSMLLSAMLMPVVAQQRITGESQENYEKRMEWFGDAKFGVFIHWGIYAVLWRQGCTRLSPSAKRLPALWLAWLARVQAVSAIKALACQVCQAVSAV